MRKKHQKDHPELRKGEVFISNITSPDRVYMDLFSDGVFSDWDRIGLKTKRLGQTAYNNKGKVIPTMFPVFAKKAELKKVQANPKQGDNLMDAMTIRFLRKSEIEKAASIVRKNYSPKYGRLASRELRTMFGKGAIKPTYFAAISDQGSKLIGFVGYTQSWMDYGVYEIFWVNVSPQYQHRGVGKQLVNTAIAAIKREKGSREILLSANFTEGLPKYYQKHFGFKTIRVFGDGYHLMALTIR